MKKVFYLKTCSTCTKILKQLDLSGWDLRELKAQNITEEELADMYALAHSYEALFSKKSTQIKARELNLKTLEEKDFKALILEHYSFLKRPVFLTQNEIFIGNEKKNVENVLLFFFGTSNKIS
jgi:arsenate reductase-like glutaredoxin family protein